jgi:hypothetical protein
MMKHKGKPCEDEKSEMVSSVYTTYLKNLISSKEW